MTATDHCVLVVVEDEPDVRFLIKAILKREPRILVTGEAASADQAIHLARTVKPCLTILDQSIEGEIMGLAAAPMLKNAAPESKILLFSAFDLSAEAEKEPAVDAFLSKSEMLNLLPTVQALLGLEPLTPAAAG